MLVPILALQLALARDSTAGPSSPEAVAHAAHAHAARAVQEFQAVWRAAWEETATERHWRIGRARTTRAAAQHCHWAETPWVIRRHVIVGGPVPAHASCPIWYPRAAPPVDDERLALDGGVSPARRPAVRARRARLRATLDSLAAALPGDLSLARQRVRFALDAGDLAGARAAADACTTDDAHCGLLRALVRHRAGDAAGADSLFEAAVAQLDDAARCAWSDVGLLLDAHHRRAHAAGSCAVRTARAERLWWLADPLWLEPGNARRAEDRARRVHVALLAAYGDDERQRWRPIHGGNAVAETLVRYGWPTQLYWFGAESDAGHDEWLRERGAAIAPPYVVREYSRGRLHLVPRGDALDAPFAAPADAWQLEAPPGDDGDDWWPVEHWARDRWPLVQLPVGQTVTLRRADGVRVAWAGDLDARALGRADGDTVRATLFAARTVGETPAVRTFVGRVGRPLVVDARLAPGEVLLGVELPGDTTRAAARTRFGLALPRTLAASERARTLSAPLLFEPPADDTRPLDADAAIARMLGTTTVTRTRRLGVYWEGYGFAPGDTVDVAVRATRTDRPGPLVRLAAALRLARAPDGTVAVRWRDGPGGSRAVQRHEGGVALQMRTIVLDLSRLPPGRYRVEVAMGVGTTIAESGRAIELR